MKADLIRMMEHLSFRNPEPTSEIHRLIQKHELILEAIDIKNYPKTIGLRERTESRCCSLWRITANRSVRKTKKALKAFLRQYDIEHPRIEVSKADRVKAYDKDGNEIDVLDMLEKQPTYGDFKIRESWEGNPLAGEPHVVGFSLENPET